MSEQPLPNSEDAEVGSQKKGEENPSKHHDALKHEPPGVMCVTYYQRLNYPKQWLVKLYVPFSNKKSATTKMYK